MGQPRQQDWIRRPTLSPRYTELRRWLTETRLRAAWDLAKRKLARTSQYPTMDLAFEIGVDRTTVYRWMNAKHKPMPVYIARIDAAFSQILGDDWTDQVERVLN